MEVPCYPVSVKALIERDGKFFFLLKEINGEIRYGLPGGLKEPGEHPEETLVRETKEETGLIVKPVRLLSATNYYHRTGRENVVLIYLAKLHRGEIRLGREPDMRFVGYRWLSPEELNVLQPQSYRELIFEAVRRALEG